MSSTRKIAVVAGVFASVAVVAAIARLVLFQPVVKHPGYLLGPGAAARVTLGASFEVILAIAAIGTAVTRYPIVKRQDHRDLSAAASEAGPVPAGSRPASPAPAREALRLPRRGRHEHGHGLSPGMAVVPADR